MSQKWILKISLFLFCYSIFGTQWMCTQSPAETSIFHPYFKPQPFPGFPLENLQGKTVNILDYQGQVLLLNFSATWCPNCREEDPSLERLSSQYSPKGLSIFLIFSRENKSTVENFIEKRALHIPCLLDAKGKIGRLLGVWALPTSYLVDRRGLVRYRALGALDWTGFEATSVIDQLLREK